MLDTQELEQVRDYVIKILPELLRSEPEIATTIEGILAEHFPRRDEFARLLDKLDKTYAEMHQSFEKVDQRFDEVDQRFEKVDQRFDEVDQRFEKVDQRFDEVDQRFEKVDQRFDETSLEMNERFERVDQRFDDVNKTLLHLRQDNVRLWSGQETLGRRIEGLENWLRFVMGDAGTQRGKDLEAFVAAALRYGLKDPDIKSEYIRLNQPLIDYNGDRFSKGYKTEIDIIAHNGEIQIFEVKATAKQGDVGFFAMKIELFALQNPDKNVRGLFINLAPSQEVRAECIQNEIELVE